MPGPKLPTQADVESYFKRLNNWGRWGHDDQRGTVNLITDARRAAARALVKSGRTVSLSREIVAQPHLQFMYHVTCPSKRERADVVLDRFDLVYHGFWITHVDALCHVGWDGELYNGRPFADSLSAAGSTWCPIDPLFDGILTRGVLLDVAAGRKEGYVTVGNPVTPKELDETAARFGVRIEPGDVVVVRSGDEKFRRENPDWIPRVSPHPGLHVSCLEWFREKDIAAISWDMMDERPIVYAAFGRPLALYHTRHEAAAVHMADAWGRLTGRPGVALVTAGPGHLNAISALYGALMEDSPVVLLSGASPRGERGLGAFQEIDQAA